MDGSLAERGVNGESIAVRDQAVWPRILALGVVLTLSVLLATVLAATAPAFWVGDLAANFPVQYAALALFLFVFFLSARRPAWAALALALVACNGMNAAPGLLLRPPDIVKGASDPVPLRLASINVFFRNDEYQRVIDFIRRERPDAVVLVEMTAQWRRSLATLEREYPHRYQTLGKGGTGVDLLSRYPLTDVGVLPIDAPWEPSIAATLQVPGRPVRVFAIHTSWPLGPSSAALRNRQLSSVAQLAARTSLPLIIAGDFNLTPFSPHFRRLLGDGKVKAAAEGFGWQPTWPVFMPPAGIQIDHAFVSPGVGVRAFRRGPTDGSDHRPILVDLVL